MSLRQDRAKRAVQSDGKATGFLSTTLFRLALQHLILGFQDRWSTSQRSLSTHRTENALGCVLFCACGVEALVNSVICWNRGASIAASRRAEVDNCLANASLRKKFESLLTPSEAVPEDLSDLICLRDEIAHFLPAMTGKENVPPWLTKLQQRGLLLGEPDVAEDDGFMLFVDRLCSYRLSYWAFEVTESALSLLCERQEFARPKIAHDLKVVRRFRALASPGSLPA